MLTFLIVTAGFMLSLGLGGFIFEKSGAARLVDRLTRDLPMYWVDLHINDEDCTPY